MKCMFLTDIEVELITNYLDTHNVIVLSKSVFWYACQSTMPRSRLQELCERQERVYREYRDNVYLSKINFC